MKQVPVLFAFLFVSLFWAGCSKSGNEVAPPANNRQLKQLTYVYDGGIPTVENYTYDQSGRLLSVINNSRSYSFSYPTATSLLITVYQLPANSLHSTIEGSFNPGGALSTLTYRNPAGQVTYTYQFSYDAAGYMTKAIGSTGLETSEERFIIQNGDVVSTTYYTNGVLTGTIQQSYDLSRQHKLPTANWYIWPSLSWFGKPNTHALTEYKQTDISGNVIWHYKQQFEVDALHYPVRKNTQFLHSGKAAVTDYLYY